MLLTLLTAASPFLAHGYVVPLPSSSTPTRLHLFHSDGFRGSPTRLQASSINVSDLDKKLKSCQSAREASRILESALGSTENGCLYNSVSIPPGAAAKGLSDGDLAIQTRLANKKYRIVDLIELSGDRDADRASLAIFCLMLASTGSALVANQSLPGPEIVRFLVVWLFSFAPLAFVGYGIATPEKLQTALVALQRNVFPAYRRRMLQHEAGEFSCPSLRACCASPSGRVSQRSSHIIDIFHRPFVSSLNIPSMALDVVDVPLEPHCHSRSVYSPPSYTGLWRISWAIRLPDIV